MVLPIDQSGEIRGDIGVISGEMEDVLTVDKAGDFCYNGGEWQLALRYWATTKASYHGLFAVQQKEASAFTRK